MRYVIIDSGDGGNDALALDTEEALFNVRRRLFDAGIDRAPVYEGDPTVGTHRTNEWVTAMAKPKLPNPEGEANGSQIIITWGVQNTVQADRGWECLKAHFRGEPGLLKPEDASKNWKDERSLSAWVIDPSKPSAGHGENTFWIITEADHSRTTVLLPEEY